MVLKKILGSFIFFTYFVSAHSSTIFFDLLNEYSRFKWKVTNRPEWILANNLYNSFLIHKDVQTQLRIPKKIHQIWLGPSPLPESFNRLQKTIQDLHSDWEYILWKDEDIVALNLVNKNMYDASNNYGQRSDIARYEILYRFGGIYLDVDFECIKSFDDLCYLNFFAGCDYGPRFTVFNGLIGCSPGNLVMLECIKALDIHKRYMKSDLNNIQATTGPYYLTRCFLKTVDKAGECVILPPQYFYPFPPHYCKMRNGAKFVQECISSKSYCVHYWQSSWMK